MRSLFYGSGQEIKPGDTVQLLGAPGEVEFVAAGVTGDPDVDWRLTQFPNGGIMVKTVKFGSMFVEADGIGEDLEFVAPSQRESG